MSRRPFLVAAFLAAGASAATAQMTIEEINPTSSTLYPASANASAGGRVTRLAVATASTFYAATEWGGLYTSVDSGLTWKRLDGHLPTAMWDVKASPLVPNRLVATSFYDGKVNSLGGINVSVNGGATWTHPPTAVPPPGFCLAVNRSQPSAFGVAFDRDSPRSASVYVGTNCGLAISNDLGATWKYVDPTPTTLAGTIWDVVVHHQGIVDICGGDGHLRSTDGGTTWQGASPGGTPLPAGQCSITASPDESYVLFASVGQSIFESDNGGGTWNAAIASPDSANNSRFAVVATNKPKAGASFDLWYGDTSLYRATCTTPAPASAGGAARCPAPPWAGGFTTTVGGHADMADIAFGLPTAAPSPTCIADCNSEKTDCENDCKNARDLCKSKVGTSGGPLASQCANEFVRCKSTCASKATACRAKCKPNEVCPIMMSSDGGIYLNTKKTGPACQTPQWTQPNVTPRALWIFGMAGANRPKDREKEDVYFVNQDNGTFATRTAGANVPPWTNVSSGDGFDVAASTSDVVYTTCCPSGAVIVPGILRGNPGMTGSAAIPTGPPGTLRAFQFLEGIARFSGRGYAAITNQGVFVTSNITSTPLTWTKLGVGPALACAIQASGPAANPVFVVQAGVCSGSGTDSVFTYQGAAAGGVWTQVNPPAAFGAGTGFGLLTVDTATPSRMFASVITPAGFQTARTVDGGVNWTADAALDGLLTAGGAIQAAPTLGPQFFDAFGTYAQPTLLAYDPQDSRTLLAGGADAGIFISRDNGATWTTITDNSGTATRPVIPRPWFAYFNRECGESNIYIATQGRGMWRLRQDEGRAAAEGVCVQNCSARAEECQRQCNLEKTSCLAAAKGDPAAIKACNVLSRTCRSKCDSAAQQCRKKCDGCLVSP